MGLFANRFTSTLIVSPMSMKKEEMFEYKDKFNKVVKIYWLTKFVVLSYVSAVVDHFARATVAVWKFVRAKWLIEILNVHLAEADADRRFNIQIGQRRLRRQHLHLKVEHTRRFAADAIARYGRSVALLARNHLNARWFAKEWVKLWFKLWLQLRQFGQIIEMNEFTFAEVVDVRVLHQCCKFLYVLNFDNWCLKWYAGNFNFSNKSLE